MLQIKSYKVSDFTNFEFNNSISEENKKYLQNIDISDIEKCFEKAEQKILKDTNTHQDEADPIETGIKTEDYPDYLKLNEYEIRPIDSNSNVIPFIMKEYQITNKRGTSIITKKEIKNTFKRLIFAPKNYEGIKLN